MAAPSQIQARYVREEDRILLRMNTIVGEEFRFWLTRRFFVRLLPVLQESLMASPAVRQQADYSSRKAVVAFEHEQAGSKAKFGQPFREAGVMPLGDLPLLVVKAGFKRLENGSLVLSLKDIAHKGIDLTLSRDLLHVLCKLLDDATGRSEWNVPTLLPGIDTSAPVPAHQLN